MVIKLEQENRGENCGTWYANRRPAETRTKKVNHNTPELTVSAASSTEM